MNKNKSRFPYTELLDLVHDGVLVLKQEKIVFSNKVFASWVGYSPSELENLNLGQLVPPEDQESILEIKALVQDKKENANTLIMTFLHRSKNDKVSVACDLSPIAEDDWAGHTVMIFKNTTSENMVRKLFESSQQTLQEIIETFPDIYYVTDATGTLLKVSPSVKKILGYDPQEVLGTPMIKYYEKPELRDQLLGQVVAAKGQYVLLEAALLHKSGKPVWFNTRARILMDPSGKILGLEGLARDATAEKNIQDLVIKRERELIEIKNELELKVKQQTEELLNKERLWLQKSRHEQMGEMISSIAHQWRQPLNVLSIWINNFSSLYRENNLQKEDIELFSEKANGIIQSMSQTINEFRSFFAPMSESDIFNLGEAISRVLQLIGPNLQDVTITFKKNAKDKIWVHGFSNEFGQVLINLLTNARESCLENKIANPTIEITLSAQDRYATIEVSDNAGGIPEIAIDKIFDPYFTTKQKGTGIGLYMSKNIVERHMKGKIFATNISSGALFKIVLPTVNQELVFNETKQGESPEATIESILTPPIVERLDHLRILFVDDNEEARVVFAMMLKKKGADVRFAGSAKEGLQVVLEFHPDLIISDILMPDGDGYSFIKTVRTLEDKALNSIPAIALSAHVGSEEVEQALSVGFDRYLTKPVEWKALMMLITELTRSKKPSKV